MASRDNWARLGGLLEVRGVADMARRKHTYLEPRGDPREHLAYSVGN